MVCIGTIEQQTPFAATSSRYPPGYPFGDDARCGCLDKQQLVCLCNAMSPAPRSSNASCLCGLCDGTSFRLNVHTRKKEMARASKYRVLTPQRVIKNVYLKFVPFWPVLYANIHTHINMRDKRTHARSTRSRDDDDFLWTHLDVNYGSLGHLADTGANQERRRRRKKLSHNRLSFTFGLHIQHEKGVIRGWMVLAYAHNWIINVSHFR